MLSLGAFEGPTRPGVVKCFGYGGPEARECREVAASSPHEADDHASACQRWWLAALLLLGPRRERAGIPHVVSGGLDPAVGTLDVRDAELVDMAIEGIGAMLLTGAQAFLDPEVLRS